MPGLGIVIAAIAEMDVEDAILHGGQDHERVRARFIGLERVESEADPLGAGVELLHARREGEDIAYRGQRAPGDVLDGQAQPGGGAGGPPVRGRVDEMRVGRRRPHLDLLGTMPDDDLCPQFDCTVDCAREQGAALARSSRIWREQGVKLLPEMDRMHARPGVSAARRELPNEASAVFAGCLEHDLQIEQSGTSGRVWNVFGGCGIERAGGKPKSQSRWLEHTQAAAPSAAGCGSGVSHQRASSVWAWPGSLSGPGGRWYQPSCAGQAHPVPTPVSFPGAPPR